jgi:hypothetical protein
MGTVDGVRLRGSGEVECSGLTAYVFPYCRGLFGTGMIILSAKEDGQPHGVSGRACAKEA